MAVITFPNRPCPKCGKPIHIKSKSHPECGWTAANSAKTQTFNGKPKSKMAAVRHILDEFGNETKPLDIKDHLKKKFNIRMDPSVISNYKSSILKQGKRKKGRKVGRPAGAPGPIRSSQTISIEDIRAVKELAERLGADRLRQLAEVLAP